MADLVLEIVEGSTPGLQMPLSGPPEIGRDKECGFVLDDQLVSRRHLRAEPKGDVLRVEDLGSLNGTFVNGNQIHSATDVFPGDQLLLGVTVLELRTSEQIAERPSAVRPLPPPLAVPRKTPDYLPKELVGSGRDVPEVDPLLDRFTKSKARLAPLALFILIVVVILIFLARAGLG